MIQKNNHIYFAIDSDILRALTNIELVRKRFGDSYNYKKSSDQFIVSYGKYLYKLLDLAKNDVVRLMIVNTVYQESKHSPSLVKFMKRNCYFPNINETNYRQRKDDVEELVNLYCQEYNHFGENKTSPFIKTYDAYANKFVPTNDCYICAEASVEYASVITGNGRHMTFDVKSEDKNSRSKGIISINIQNGYYCEGINGKQVPHPYTISTIGPILCNCDKREFDFPICPDYSKVPVKDVDLEKIF